MGYSKYSSMEVVSPLRFLKAYVKNATNGMITNTKITNQNITSSFIHPTQNSQNVTKKMKG